MSIQTVLYLGQEECHLWTVKSSVVSFEKQTVLVVWCVFIALKKSHDHILFYCVPKSLSGSVSPVQKTKKEKEKRFKHGHHFCNKWRNLCLSLRSSHVPHLPWPALLWSSECSLWETLVGADKKEKNLMKYVKSIYVKLPSIYIVTLYFWIQNEVHLNRLCTKAHVETLQQTTYVIENYTEPYFQCLSCSLVQ